MRALALAAAPAAALVLAACAGPADRGPAPDTAWELVPDQSRLSFVSVKAAEIAEVHHFERLSGSVSADGTAVLEIPLDSLETGIDIRNERMREFLFQTGLFPSARLTATIDLAQFRDLGIGDQRRIPLAGELSLHGVTAPIETEVTVTRAAADKVVVASLDPIVVNAESFDMGAGVTELMKLANLPSIAPDAPVTFQLMFRARA
ncbi:MAG: YceI family protein [Sphingomonadaceae bacterium]